MRFVDRLSSFVDSSPFCSRTEPSPTKKSTNDKSFCRLSDAGALDFVKSADKTHRLHPLFLSFVVCRLSGDRWGYPGWFHQVGKFPFANSHVNRTADLVFHMIYNGSTGKKRMLKTQITFVYVIIVSAITSLYVLNEVNWKISKLHVFYSLQNSW